MAESSLQNPVRSFLDLPFELRREVYHHYFSHRAYTPRHIRLHPQQQCLDSIALLLVSKSVSEEALDILYGKALYQICLPGTSGARFKNYITNRNMQRIRKVQFQLFRDKELCANNLGETQLDIRIDESVLARTTKLEVVAIAASWYSGRNPYCKEERKNWSEKHFREPEKIAQEMKKRKDAKLQMAPMGGLQKSLEKQKIEDSSGPEQHSKWLREFFSQNEATNDPGVQLCQSLSQQPVEECGHAWDETAFPFQTVANIAFPKQESFSNERRIFWEDAMKLNVCYGLKDLQPLGSVNRLRKRLYENSAQNRAKGNLTEPVAVENIDQIP
ncbi:ABC1 family protein [Venturia nashicola]|uniref:ABC1 family protein n=1 Tax=Venturia nashicola TaxID=86259 RepID=A0A4Z1P1U7_9PEZI|nr:ABC1 family protein [Venturia nashicola]